MKKLGKYWLVCPVAFLLIGYLLISALVTGGRPLTQEQAQTLARQTFTQMYGLTVSQGESCALLETRETSGEGWRGYLFRYAVGRGDLTVTVDATDGSATCDRTAEEIRAFLTAPAGSPDTRDATAEWEAARGGTPIDFWPLESKAEFAAQYYPSPDSLPHYYGVPTADELSPDEAEALAREAVRERLGYDDERMDGLTAAIWFYRDAPASDGGKASYYEIMLWRRISDDPSIGGYAYQAQARVDPATGTVASVSEAPGGSALPLAP